MTSTSRDTDAPRLRDETTKESQAIVRLDVSRPVLEESDLRQLYQYEKPKIPVIQNIKKSIESVSCKGCIKSVIPATSWLSSYRWKSNFIFDVISGLTVAIMHIPQGMAYGLLGNLSPVVGIYMAFFPVLFYSFLSTSRHVSLGTFAVVCLMTGRAVTSYAIQPDLLHGNNTDVEFQLPDHKDFYTPMQVATTVTFMVGLIQLVMCVFRLGVISTLLSETFVSGFTTGAAVQVLLSQVFDLIGLYSKKPRGYFRFFKTIVVIFNDIPNANTTAVVISLIAMCLMVLSNEFVKPWASKRCRIPLPTELLAVVIGTMVSRYCELENLYNIKVVGNIPTGLPKPDLPAFKLLPTVALESIAISMVSYTVTMSMGLIFAKKLHYDVDSNQELFAMGSSNIFGSFFSCMPISASLSRSLIQEAVGGRTQIASLVSCLILLVILLWIGPFFEPLPRCILASIIIVALKGMVIQAKDFVRFWKLSKIEGAVWFFTFVTTVLIDIDVGLIVGLSGSIASILFQSVKPYSCLLGHVPNTELYLDTSRYMGVGEIFGIKIYHYAGNLNFVNASNLSRDLKEKAGVDPRRVLKYRAKLARKGIYEDSSDFDNKYTLRCVIIDMSGVPRIDSSGVRELHEVVTEFSRIDIPVYLAACPVLVFDQIQRCDKVQKRDSSFQTFATVHDAVFYAQRGLLFKSN